MQRFSWPSRPDSKDSNGTEIIVLCDGTGKNGRADKDPTNVYWLYSLLGAPPTSSDGTKVVRKRKRKLLYIPGVGAESKGIPKYLALVFGKTIVEMVIKAYMYIADNYQPGDTVCIFGYSRGAFVARKVAGLLHRIGAVGSEAELLSQWQRREKPVPWDQVKEPKHPVPVRCLGVWDTVGAIYSSPECEEKDLLGIPDAELPPNVELALHVLAYHENRKRFRVTLFKPNKITDLKEIWFPGAHSDVGGGGEKPTDLPRISLIWMIGELSTFLDISDNDRVRYPVLADLEPSDAYNDSPAFKRMVDKFETRLESKALTPTAKVHQTLQGIKQESNRTSHNGHRQLTFNDLLALKWSAQTGIVLWNTLELLKQSKVMRREQQRWERTRVHSMPAVMASRLHRLSTPPGLQIADVQTESPTEDLSQPREHRWSISSKKRLKPRATTT